MDICGPRVRDVVWTFFTIGRFNIEGIRTFPRFNDGSFRCCRMSDESHSQFSISINININSNCQFNHGEKTGDSHAWYPIVLFQVVDTNILLSFRRLLQSHSISTEGVGIHPAAAKTVATTRWVKGTCFGSHSRTPFVKTTSRKSSSKPYVYGMVPVVYGYGS